MSKETKRHYKTMVSGTVWRPGRTIQKLNRAIRDARRGHIHRAIPVYRWAADRFERLHHDPAKADALRAETRIMERAIRRRRFAAIVA